MEFAWNGENEKISVCNNVPSTEKDLIQKNFNELEKLKHFDEGSIQTNNSTTGAMLGGPQTSSQLYASNSQLNNLWDVKGRKILMHLLVDFLQMA